MLALLPAAAAAAAAAAEPRVPCAGPTLDRCSVAAAAIQSAVSAPAPQRFAAAAAAASAAAANLLPALKP